MGCGVGLIKRGPIGSSHYPYCELSKPDSWEEIPGAAITAFGIPVETNKVWQSKIGIVCTCEGK